MKKVRYALGAVGTVPAIAMMTQGPAANAQTLNTSNRVVKTVAQANSSLSPAYTCYGHTFHTTSTNGLLKLVFWSTNHGSKVCIGTMTTKITGHPFAVMSEYIRRPTNFFCVKTAAAESVTEGCHKSFYTPFSVVGHAVWNSPMSHGNMYVSYFVP